MARVLFVDDDAGLRETCGAILRGAGLHVEAASDGRAALATLERQPCELLLLDLKLPDMSGLDVLASVRRRGYTTPVVFMTGYASLDTAVEAMRLGAVDYLRKPVFEEPLLAAVHRALTCAASPVTSTAIGARVDGLRAIQACASQAAPMAENLPGVADGLELWASAVWRVVRAPSDVRNVGQWARLLKVSEDTVYHWCRTADVRAKASLDLARVLRAVRQARGRGGRPAQFLAVSDRHTLRRLFVRAGVGEGTVMSDDEVLVRQTFTRDPLAVAALRERLREEGSSPEQR